MRGVLGWVCGGWHWGRNRACICPVRVVDAKFVSAEWIAGLERIGTNAFFFSLYAELRIRANKASIGNENERSVKEGESVSLPEWEIHSLTIALVNGFTALSFEALSEKSVEKTDVAAWPANGYTNLGMKTSLACCCTPANGMATVV